jgi:hypothetical protein
MTSIEEDNTMNTTVLPDSPSSSVSASAAGGTLDASSRSSPVGFSSNSPGYKTPPRAVSAGSPPAAPLRVRRADSLVGDDDTDTSPDADCNCFGHRIGRVLIPSIDYHKGKGILAGDFIKPDPTATMTERQTHILTELHRWLSGRIQVHARDVWSDSMGQDEIMEMIDAGMWPAARLHMIVRARTTATDDRTAPELVYHETATWAASICMQYLIDGVEADNSVVDMAIGFVTTDKLPDGSTILEHWDAPSVFEPLREAGPLSLDDRIDAAIGIWETQIKIEAPVWVWSIAVVWFLIYAWLVAALVDSMRTSR